MGDILLGCVSFCAVQNCPCKRSKGLHHILFHEFPTNTELRDIWIRNIKRPATWTPNACATVCSLHFTKDSYETGIRPTKLLPSAVPTLFSKKTMQTFQAESLTSFVMKRNIMRYPRDVLIPHRVVHLSALPSMNNVIKIVGQRGEIILHTPGKTYSKCVLSSCENDRQQENECLPEASAENNAVPDIGREIVLTKVCEKLPSSNKEENNSKVLQNAVSLLKVRVQIVENKNKIWKISNKVGNNSKSPGQIEELFAENDTMENIEQETILTESIVYEELPSSNKDGNNSESSGQIENTAMQNIETETILTESIVCGELSSSGEEEINSMVREHDYSVLKPSVKKVGKRIGFLSASNKDESISKNTERIGFLSASNKDESNSKNTEQIEVSIGNNANPNIEKDTFPSESIVPEELPNSNSEETNSNILEKDEILPSPKRTKNNSNEHDYSVLKPSVKKVGKRIGFLSASNKDESNSKNTEQIEVSIGNNANPNIEKDTFPSESIVPEELPNSNSEETNSNILEKAEILPSPKRTKNNSKVKTCRHSLVKPIFKSIQKENEFLTSSKNDGDNSEITKLKDIDDENDTVADIEMETFPTESTSNQNLSSSNKKENSSTTPSRNYSKLQVELRDCRRPSCCSSKRKMGENDTRISLNKKAKSSSEDLGEEDEHFEKKEYNTRITRNKNAKLSFQEETNPRLSRRIYSTYLKKKDETLKKKDENLNNKKEITSSSRISRNKHAKLDLLLKHFRKENMKREQKKKARISRQKIAEKKLLTNMKITNENLKKQLESSSRTTSNKNANLYLPGENHGEKDTNVAKNEKYCSRSLRSNTAKLNEQLENDRNLKSLKENLKKEIANLKLQLENQQKLDDNLHKNESSSSRILRHESAALNLRLENLRKEIAKLKLKLENPQKSDDNLHKNEGISSRILRNESATLNLQLENSQKEVENLNKKEGICSRILRNESEKLNLQLERARKSDDNLNKKEGRSSKISRNENATLNLQIESPQKEVENLDKREESSSRILRNEIAKLNLRLENSRKRVENLDKRDGSSSRILRNEIAKLNLRLENSRKGSEILNRKEGNCSKISKNKSADLNLQLENSPKEYENLNRKVGISFRVSRNESVKLNVQLSNSRNEDENLSREEGNGSQLSRNESANLNLQLEKSRKEAEDLRRKEGSTSKSSNSQNERLNLQLENSKKDDANLNKKVGSSPRILRNQSVRLNLQSENSQKEVENMNIREESGSMTSRNENVQLNLQSENSRLEDENLSRKEASSSKASSSENVRLNSPLENPRKEDANLKLMEENSSKISRLKLQLEILMKNNENLKKILKEKEDVNSRNENAKLKLMLENVKKENELLKKHLNSSLYEQIREIKRKVGQDQRAQFLIDQVESYGEEVVSWSEETIRRCILWYAKSPSAYAFAETVLTIPSYSTLKSFMPNIDGITEQILLNLFE